MLRFVNHSQLAIRNPFPAGSLFDFVGPPLPQETKPPVGYSASPSGLAVGFITPVKAAAIRSGDSKKDFNFCGDEMDPAGITYEDLSKQSLPAFQKS